MEKNKKEIIQKFDEKLGIKYENISKLEEFLSKKFQDEIDTHEDAQTAFNELNSEFGGLLSEYFCYTLTEEGTSWSVDTGDLFDLAKLNEYIDTFKEHYKEEFKTIDDLTSKLENRVLKDMSNAGCDCKSALQMILEEDLALEGVFTIEGADAEPRIELA